MSSKKDNRKVGRVKLEHPLKVVIGSIGADVRYDLLTKDISPNGFFLDFESPGRFPFTQASIMEVWLTLTETQTIFFNGKMARTVYPTNAADSSPGIAVKIVQIKPEHEQLLLDFITSQGGSNDDDDEELSTSIFS
jgi:hypothetical protein